MPLDNFPSNAASEGPDSAPLDILADIATDMLDRDDSDTWPPVVVDGLPKIKNIAAVSEKMDSDNSLSFFEVETRHKQ